MKKFFFLFQIFLSSLIFAQKTPAPFSPLAVKAFADSLYEEGFFREAEGEYKRYLFSINSPDETALFPLLSIYNSQNSKTGIFWLKKNFYEGANPNLKEKMNLVQARMIFLERKSRTFSEFHAEINEDFSVFSLDFQNLVNLSDFLLSKNIEESLKISKNLAEQNEIFLPLSQLCESYQPKSAGLAVFLSALVPGLGKFYGGTKGGFFSDFALVGACTAGCLYTGIQSDWKNWRPYLFAAMGATFFVVDLYGSHQNIKRCNAAQIRKIYEETDRIYEKMY